MDGLTQEELITQLDELYGRGERVFGRLSDLIDTYASDDEHELIVDALEWVLDLARIHS